MSIHWENQPAKYCIASQDFHSFLLATSKVANTFKDARYHTGELLKRYRKYWLTKAIYLPDKLNTDKPFISWNNCSKHKSHMLRVLVPVRHQHSGALPATAGKGGFVVVVVVVVVAYTREPCVPCVVRLLKQLHLFIHSYSIYEVQK
jgi:hypothetical protein